MWDKLEISFLFIWGKPLFLLPPKRILAGNGKLSRKHKEISLPCAAFRSTKGRFGMQGSGAPWQGMPARLNNFQPPLGAFLLTHRLRQEPKCSQLLHLETLQKWIWKFQPSFPPKICFSKNSCMYSLRSCCLKSELLFSWRSNQQVKNGCEILPCTESLYVLEIPHQ